VTQKGKHIFLSAGTASVFENLAEQLGLVTRRGGEKRGNITGLLTLLARSIETGVFAPEDLKVTPAKVTPAQLDWKSPMAERKSNAQDST